MARTTNVSPPSFPILTATSSVISQYGRCGVTGQFQVLKFNASNRSDLEEECKNTFRQRSRWLDGLITYHWSDNWSLKVISCGQVCSFPLFLASKELLHSRFKVNVEEKSSLFLRKITKALLLKQWSHDAGRGGMRVSVIIGGWDIVPEAHCVLYPFTHKIYCSKVE